MAHSVIRQSQLLRLDSRCPNPTSPRVCSLSVGCHESTLCSKKFYRSRNLTLNIDRQGVGNHEESVHQLAKALYRFADCLPRQELKQILYPSLQMQEAVAKLYSKLIQFMVHAMHWYQKGKARRAIGAIFKPFALDFQDQLTEVNELSRSVDEIANTAAQAELRAVHAKIEDAYKELGDAHKELSLARLEIKRLGEVVSFEADRVFQVASCTITGCLQSYVLTVSRHSITLITDTAGYSYAIYNDQNCSTQSNHFSALYG